MQGTVEHEYLQLNTLPGKNKKHENQKVGDTSFWLIHVIYNVEHQFVP